MPIALRMRRARLVAPLRRGLGLISLPGPRPNAVSTPTMINAPAISARISGTTLEGSGMAWRGQGGDVAPCDGLAI